MSRVRPSTSAVESATAALMGRNSATLTSSGSAGLIVAAKAMNLPIGSEVIIPAICCPAVLFASQIAGYNPVIADIDPSTMNAEVDQLREVLTQETSAIVVVHCFGKPCDLDKVVSFAREHKLAIIEDACLSYGLSVDTQGDEGSVVKPLGSFGDVSLISFGYDKPIECHYGGALATDCGEISARIKTLIAENAFFQFDETRLQTDLLLERVAALPEQIDIRLENIKRYSKEVRNQNFTKLAVDEKTALWRYPLLVNGDRDALVARAKAESLIFTTHYKSLADLSTNANCPNATRFADHVINAFVRPQTPRETITRSIEFLNGYVDV